MNGKEDLETKVSIIIPTHNNLDLTKNCLKSLQDNTEKKYLSDVIIVDDCSSDGTRQYLKSLDWVRALFNEKNLSFSGTNNVGAKNAKGDILIFLNLDTKVTPGWIEPLIDCLKDKGTAVCGSKLLFPDGKIQHAGIVISKDLVPRHIYYRLDQSSPLVNKKREFQAVTAACLAIKREVFERVGGFDESYKMGMEDIDLCLKVKETGYKVYYCPNSVVIHFESVSEGRFSHNFENENIFQTKWKGKLISDEEKYYQDDGVGKFYTYRKNLENKYLRQYPEKKGLLFRFFQIIFIFVNRMQQGIALLIRFNFKELYSKLKKVIK